MLRDKERRRRRPRNIVGGLILVFIVIGVAGALAHPMPTEAAVNTAPPVSPVKLVFVHHSVGEGWLADGHGGLGMALRDNNYFVSETNYGWGSSLPSSRGLPIGDTTDLGDWWIWFRGPSSPTYLSALYAESGQHGAYLPSYTRLATNPGGPNEIVLFKSCFGNSNLSQSDAPVPQIADNPMKGKAWDYASYTVANAKGIYLDLLPYFGAHPEKLFVAVVAPPVPDGDTPGGRALANWLVDHWLQDSGYTAGNVLVFDFYNVLTSKTGGGASDVALETGNHHRIWNGAVQHKTDDGVDRSLYAISASDYHPNAAGDQKATAEFVPLLNAAYNVWKGNGGGDTTGPRTFAPHAASVRKGQRATLYYKVTDDIAASATVTIRIRTRTGALKKTLALGLRGTGPERHVHFTWRLARGIYRFTVEARDLSGNRAQTPLGSNRLTVR